MTSIKNVEGALGKILFGFVPNDSSQIKTDYLYSLNGGLVMTYTGDGYGSTGSFEDGKTYYDSAMDKKEQGRNDDAREDFRSAESIFTICSGQHTQAAHYLELTQQELKNLG